MSTPTSTPILFPTPSTDHYLAADFQTCFSMGSASPENEPDVSLHFECIPEPGSGNIAAKLEYETPKAWASFWIGLEDADFSLYDTLTFFAKGDTSEGIPQIIKLELKRQDGSRVGVFNLAGLTEQWQQFVVPLEKFRTPPRMLALCGWDNMHELVFTFESERAGAQGTVYLDEIYVEQRTSEAPTPGPECSAPVLPTPTPSTSVGSLVVADFDNCNGTNNLDGPMGAAYNAPDNLAETYLQEPGQGCVARLHYQIGAWAAFWMRLQGVDLTPYSKLTFDVKADPQTGVPEQMKIELKRANNTEVSVFYAGGITADWQTISVNLSDFGSPGYGSPLSSFAQMEELVFTFEANRSGRQGVVYLDNIAFTP